jgi:hypothetical protein
MTNPSRSLAKLLAVLLLLLVEESMCWPQPFSNTLLRRKATTLRIVSQEAASTTTETTGATRVPYVIARGDGTTGGGGLPMPHYNVSANEHVDDVALLKRPKVGADMPIGRPSWFRVPAPSQSK